MISSASSPRVAIVIFLIIAFGLSAIFYAFIIATQTVSPVYVTGLMWCPGLGAILTCLILRRSLGSIGWAWRPGYALAGYLIPIAYCLVASIGIWVLGFGGFPNLDFVKTASEAMGLQSLSVWLFIAIYVVIIGTTGMVTGVALALGEEIGWRGFLVSELAKVTSFTGTALISGLIWAV